MMPTINRLRALFGGLVSLALTVGAIVAAVLVPAQWRLVPVAFAIFCGIGTVAAVAQAMQSPQGNFLGSVCSMLMLFDVAVAVAWGSTLLVPIKTVPASEMGAYRSARPCEGGRLPEGTENCTAVTELTLPAVNSSATVGDNHSSELTLTLSDGSRHHLQVDDTKIAVRQKKSLVTYLAGMPATVTVWGARVPVITVNGNDLVTNEYPGSKVDGGVSQFRTIGFSLAAFLVAIGLLSIVRGYRKLTRG